jgi:tRNA-2-methylthio-N6-dimethylallyladenosine synthase
VMTPHGYESTSSPEDADLIVLNTRHIREKASEKVYSELGRLKQYKDARQKQGQKTLIAVAGCVAQAEGEEIFTRSKMVDLVFGPQTYHRLPEFAIKAFNDGERIFNTDFPEEDKFDHLPQESQVNKLTAFLSVQEGCDKFCTFCVVPYTRGAERSRSVKSLLEEAKLLRDKGVKELTLLGQNVNGYHGEAGMGKSASLAELIAYISDIDGIERIRYTTSHPNDMSDDLIEAHRSNNKLMPYLHLPVQAGSNSILEAMNRHHTIEKYLDIINSIRSVRHDIAISGDFIVGFPGETEEDFEKTMEVIRKVNYSSAFSFKYSRRPGTPAASMRKQVVESVKIERLNRLQELLFFQQESFNKSKIGQTLPVLFEKKGRFEGQIVGRSPYLQPVIIKGDISLIGQIYNVAIIEATSHSLLGTIILNNPNNG